MTKKQKHNKRTRNYIARNSRRAFSDRFVKMQFAPNITATIDRCVTFAKLAPDGTTGESFTAHLAKNQPPVTA